MKKTFNGQKILYKDFVVEFYRCEGREIYGKSIGHYSQVKTNEDE